MREPTPGQPTLTDGVVTLRPWRDDDIEAAIRGHDETIAHWFGFPEGVIQPPRERMVAAVERWRAAYDDGRREVNFVVEHQGQVAGTVEVRRGDGTGELSWTTFADHRRRGVATRAVRMLIDWAFSELGLTRVEAHVEPANRSSLMVASRAGLRREGVRRVAPGSGDRPDTHEYVILARLASDPPLSDPESFRALLNSFLPRKRAIGQLLVRDQHGRVLLCQLTYKRDWDLPGGVVEMAESPRLAVGREVEEELGLTLPAGRLLITDWLPPWGGWEDAICLVFDGGVHPGEIAAEIVPQPREILTAEFCTLDQIRERATDFTTRRIEAALAVATDQPGSPTFTESGRDPA